MKPERNDPCPCGSGKKYKKCCGANSVPAQTVGANARERVRQALVAGDLPHADQACRELFQQAPQDAEANHLCGIVSYRLGRLDEAKGRLQIAINATPDQPYLHSNLSLILRDAGELEAAASSARRAIALNPELAEAHDNLATIFRQQGEATAAVASSHTAIRLNPANPLFHVNLGETLLNQDNLDDAERSLRAALNLAPNLPPVLSGMGTLRLKQARWVEARDWLEKAVSAGADDAVVFNNLGHALFRLKDAKAAEVCYRRALELKPDFGGAHYNLGRVLEDRNNKLAVEAYFAAMHFGYSPWEVYDSLFRAATHFSMVDRVYASALRLADDQNCHPELLPAILIVLGQACDFSARRRAWNRFRLLIQERRLESAVAKYVLMTSLYPADLGDEFVWALHRLAGEAIDAQAKGARFPVSAAVPGQKLRIGYLSADLRQHSVGHFIRHVIANHDHNAVEIFCYSLSNESDSITDDIRRNATRFHEVASLDYFAIAQRIHDDGIHILVDLSGHSLHSGIEVLAFRPAPIQVTWIGYLHSTGMHSVDFRITDPYADDPATTLGTERLLILPESFLCMGVFPEVDIKPEPALVGNGVVTFASFNNLTKITSEAVRVWARVLAAVPGSRMLIAAADADSNAVGQNVRAEFAKYGIEPERVQFRGVMPRNEYLGAHNDVDIILDTWPFNGGTVTAGALWMGVPVVTLVGTAHRQRVTYSMLRNIGVESTIAWSEAEYVQIAAQLAGDPQRLADLRRSIATNTRKSILCDAPRFTRQLEAALQRVWAESHADRASVGRIIS